MGLLTALALILGYLESLLPIAPGLPGVKIGLSNCAVLLALRLLDAKKAFFLLLLKVTLSALLFASPAAFFYSLGGGLLAFLLMLLCGALFGASLSLPAVSLAGALGHNLGQLFVAALTAGLRPALGYAPILLLSSLPAGLLVGFVSAGVLRLLEKEGTRR